ncbi:MAG: hypothetical protein ABSH01_10185, partial [Terriglobia bacterium]
CRGGFTPPFGDPALRDRRYSIKLTYYLQFNQLATRGEIRSASDAGLGASKKGAANSVFLWREGTGENHAKSDWNFVPAVRTC